MKLRIAALALAVAFAAAPALGVIARHDCCAEPEAGGPCSSLTAMSCCGDIASAAPAQSTPDASSLHAIAGSSSAFWVAAVPAAPRAAPELARETSPLRLSVVLRL